MEFLYKIADTWYRFTDRLQPAKEVLLDSMSTAGYYIRRAWRFVFRLRKIILAIPVAWLAVKLALDNMVELPSVVGITLQNDGVFSMLLARELAVLGPLALTALCLVLMFVSRRILTPWFVSLVTLVLPVLIRILNTFPT
jgi:hypothetical protein